jgi:hypothetical protein
MCEKSAKSGQFLSRVMKNMHYGPISQKKAVTIFFKFTFLECVEGPQQHPIERYLEV